MTALPVGWKPIESAPKDGSRVLLWNRHFDAPCSGQFYGFGDWRMDGNLPPFVYQPSHWMPLPAAPCQTCNGHGMVGGLTPHSGYDAEPCPDCSTPPASAQDDAKDVPVDVMAALDRMCTPLHTSVLSGATADADAFSMQLIRDYILRRPAPAAGDARDAERYRSHRAALTSVDTTWLDNVTAALEAMGLDPDGTVLPTAEQVDAAFDAAIAAQQGKGEV